MNINYISDAYALRIAVEQLREEHWLAVDTETTSTYWPIARLRTIQLATKDTAYIFPMVRRDLLRDLHLLLREKPLVAHNWKYDAHVLEEHGLGCDIEHCTMTLQRLTYPEMRRIGLSESLHRWGLGRFDMSGALKAHMKEQELTFETIDPADPVMQKYAGADALGVANLFYAMEDLIEGPVYRREMQMQKVLYDMERRGLPINADYCEQTSVSLAKQSQARIAECQKRFGISLRSTKALREFVQAEKVTGLLRSPTGKISLSEESILASSGHPVLDLLLEKNSLEKQRVNWIDKFQESCFEGRSRTAINPVGATTGRMTASYPPVLTIPRTSLARSCIAAPPGRKLIVIDYSQQELRLIASFTQDKALMAAIESGDAHSQIAARVFGSGFTAQQRQTSKSSVFAIMYGAGSKRLTGLEGFDTGKARDLITAMRKEFPRACSLSGMAQATAIDAKGFAEIRTPFGRRVRVPSRQAWILGNHLVQSTGVDVLKRAIIELERAGLGDYLLLPVHDELVFEASDADAEEVARAASRIMQNHEFTLPLTTEASIVQSWGEKYP